MWLVLIATAMGKYLMLEYLLGKEHPVLPITGKQAEDFYLLYLFPNSNAKMQGLFEKNFQFFESSLNRFLNCLMLAAFHSSDLFVSEATEIVQAQSAPLQLR